MSIKKLTFGETYYLSKAEGYRREVVDWCWEVYGQRPIDCFGNVVGRSRSGSGQKRYKAKRSEVLERAEWV